MKTSVKETILSQKMIAEGDRVIVALSGGADSVALLSVLNELKAEIGFALSACHVNHNLRGEESDADERYVRTLCAGLKIPLDVRSIDVLSLQKKHESVEECARRARYEFFGEISRGAKIATAHTASDNAETVLLNLVRGTALKGLCGIPPVRGNIIRPLIYATRAEIEAYCAEKGLRFVTDKTNFSEDYTRNKIRLNVIPKLKEINPSLNAGISRMTRALGEDDALLRRYADEIKEKAKINGGYDAKTIAAAEKPLRSRIISSVLADNNISPSSLRISQIEAILPTGGKINIEKNKFAVVRRGVFKIDEIVQLYRK